jgi:hypothetical protein
VENTQSVKVVLSDQREYNASVLGRDEIRDLAILQIYAPVLPKATLGDSVRLALGDKVIAIGYPLDLAGGATISTGVVSAFRDDEESGLTYIQTDAAINPGSSGGAIINSAGEVVGITVMSIRVAGGQPIQGMNFAIAINSAKLIIPKLIAGESVLKPLQIYSNDDWGYSIQYPGSWTLRKQEKDQVNNTFTYQVFFIEGEGLQITIHCSQNESPLFNTLSEGIDFSIQANKKTFLVFDILARTNLRWQGLYDACEITRLEQYNASSPLQKVKNLSVDKNNLYSYSVSASVNALEYDRCSPIIDAIINSFRLIN